MNINLLRSIIVAAGLVLTLASCGGDKSGGDVSAEVVSQAQTLMPSDAELASIYARSCKTCHSVAGTGAPLTGDTVGWQPRMDQGMDVMVDHVITGFGGMPPFGFCMDCDADQFQALIKFMVEGE